MEYTRFVFNPIQENTYVVFDETGEAAIIDAGNYCAEENEKLASFVKNKNLTIKYILNTHNHWDHIFGNQWLAQQYKPEICCHSADMAWLDNFGTICEAYGFGIRQTPQPTKLYADGDIIKFGNTELKVIHTPGHSAGSVSLYCEAAGVLFSGDTLFFESVGRTDFPGGSTEQIITSIKKRLFALPPTTIVLPGHGIETTIETEQKNNPYLQ